MAIMDPARIPATRDHLDHEDRCQLLRLELFAADGRFDDAQEIAEDLWIEATDAHKRLYQGLSNAFTAAAARQALQRRGAAEIARRTREILAPYPHQVLGLDLAVLLESLDHLVQRGDGPLLLKRQG